MTYRVELTFRAERDVDLILKYLSERSPQGASTWAARWDEILGGLAESAERTQLAPESDDHQKILRHVVFKTRRGKKYRAIFYIDGPIVYVTHVRGPGQDVVPPEELPNG